MWPIHQTPGDPNVRQMMIRLIGISIVRPTYAQNTHQFPLTRTYVIYYRKQIRDQTYIICKRRVS